MLRVFILLSTVGYFAIAAATEAPDYCDTKKFCPFSDGPHIQCNNDGTMGPKCPDDAKLIPMDEELRNRIVLSHNQYRNRTAAGLLAGYSPAVRMAKMSWCKDLAQMAELNVKRCVFEHDECRNTERFPVSGQNLATLLSNEDMPAYKNSTVKIFLDMVDMWFDEHQEANMRYIDKYADAEEAIGHFTVMMAERNYCLGCAAIKYQIEEETQINFACNYAWSNVFDNPIYVSGATASKCETGADKEFTALCSDKEAYGEAY